MNIGLQLFLSGINEYFSTTGLSMTVVMATCFVPVPFTILIYNKVVSKWGLGVAYRYILGMYSLGMVLMGFCRMLPEGILLPYAIVCSLIVSFAIGAFFSVTYTVPSQRAAVRKRESETASSMYFAVQGLFEGASAGLATYGILVLLKQTDTVQYLTLIVAAACMLAFFLSFFLPKAISGIGKQEGK
jgi:MFS family permease